jgi:hypothetical protein
MSTIVYRICVLLQQSLVSVPLGTNLGLAYLLFALLSGRFMAARGAVFTALSALSLPAEAVRRAGAALSYGQWQIAALLRGWRHRVLAEGRFRVPVYEGVRPVACDLVGFFRPRLAGCAGQHYHSQADKALPALVLGLLAEIGTVGTQRLALPRLLLRQELTETSEALQRRLVSEAALWLTEEEALIVEAGFALADLLSAGVRFVVRLKKNTIARRNRLPVYKGKGRPPEYGERARPLSGKRTGQRLPATPPDRTARWKAGGRVITAHLFDNLVGC